MTELKTDTSTQIRDLTAEETQAVCGGAFLWVSPLIIHGFNPQPDPPAMPVLASPQLAH
jgi:hypothetical protein